MGTEGRIENVSDTALWVAVYRAQEGERTNPIFRDPLAAVLAGERGRQIAASMPGSRFTEWVLVTRTSAIDRYIKTLVAQGVDTIVNLGAGLDTRPYRMDLPKNLRWVEADFPHMITYKNVKLKSEVPNCRLEREAVDLSRASERQALLQRINGESRNIAVITEGVLMYLTNAQVKDLAQDLHQCRNIGFWIHDWFSEDALAMFRKLSSKKLKAAPIPFDPREGWFEFFAARGWKLKENSTYAEEGARIGRNSILPWTLRALSAVFSKANKSLGKVGGAALLHRV